MPSDLAALMGAALRPYLEPHANGLPRLTFLPGTSCQAVGGRPEWADELTTAWLLFYIAAHLMDSVEDRDPHESWWADLSSSVGINVATGLYFSANAVLTRLDLLPIPAARQAATQIVPDFHYTLLKMAGGQQIDLSQKTLTLEQYWQIASQKSGSFFGLACRSGARLGSGSDDQADALSRYGIELGILIQILDDVDAVQHYLDPAAETERAHFLHALPAVYALQILPDKQKERLTRELSAAPGDLDVAASALELIEASGAGLYMLAEVQRHRAEALAALDSASLEESSKNNLIALIEKITTSPEP